MAHGLCTIELAFRVSWPTLVTEHPRWFCVHYGPTGQDSWRFVFQMNSVNTSNVPERSESIPNDKRALLLSALTGFEYYKDAVAEDYCRYTDDPKLKPWSISLHTMPKEPDPNALVYVKSQRGRPYAHFQLVHGKIYRLRITLPKETVETCDLCNWGFVCSVYGTKFDVEVQQLCLDSRHIAASASVKQVGVRISKELEPGGLNQHEVQNRKTNSKANTNRIYHACGTSRQISALLRTDNDYSQGLRCLVCKADQWKVERLHRCPTCRSSVYCSRQCQILDWKNGHKLACESYYAFDRVNELRARKIATLVDLLMCDKIFRKFITSSDRRVIFRHHWYGDAIFDDQLLRGFLYAVRTDTDMCRSTKGGNFHFSVTRGPRGGSCDFHIVSTMSALVPDGPDRKRCRCSTLDGTYAAFCCLSRTWRPYDACGLIERVERMYPNLDLLSELDYLGRLSAPLIVEMVGAGAGGGGGGPSHNWKNLAKIPLETKTVVVTAYREDGTTIITEVDESGWIVIDGVRWFAKTKSVDASGVVIDMDAPTVMEEVD